MKKSSATTRDVLRVFWNHSKKYPISLAVIVFAIACATVTETLAPLFYKRFFDTLSSTSDGRTDQLVTLLIVISGIHCIGWIMWRTGVFVNNFFVLRVSTDLRQSAFAKMMRHSYSFFSNNFGGSLVQKVNRFSRAYESVSEKIYFDFVGLVVRIVGVMIVLFFFNKTTALILSAWVFVFMVVNIWFAKWRLPFNILRAQKESESSAVLSDAVTNHTNIQMFSGYMSESDRLNEVTESQRIITKKTYDQQEVANAIQSMLIIVVEFVLFYYMVKHRGENAFFTVGTFILVQAYIWQLIEKLWNLGRVIRQLYESFADAKEMVDILQTSYDIKDAKTATELKVKKGQIDFKKVSFHFHKTRQVLDNLSLTIRPGERVALVGHSGAGKSTLIKLLFRLYDPADGRILIDGQDIKKVTQESLRNAIGMVPQDPILFHRTLMDNIRYGRRDATDEEVVEAARKAHCHNFIATLPDGYHTFVGERGIKLSGGERQRVAIARAFLKNAPILVLDEATSSLDSEVELSIQESLRELMRDKTVLVIAHRLSTIRQMDRIVVLSEGAIVDQGTHEDLLESQGLYASLWRLQSGGFITMKDTE